MQALIDRLRPRWPLFAFLASGALLAGAHAFETFGGLAPCVMCLQQREAHWLILAVSGALFALSLGVKHPKFARGAALVLGALFLWSLYKAGYHVAVEQHWVYAQCETTRGGDDILAFDVNAPIELPSCDKIAWQMFGISMAGYNGLASLAMAALSFLIAFLPARKGA